MKLNYLRAICIGICLVFAIAGLWPLDFRPRNNTAWPPHAPGFVFGWQSVAYSEGEIELGNAQAPPAEPASISIELWLKSLNKPNGELHSILSLYDGNDPENLMLAEWESELLMRTAFWNTRGQRKYREMGVAAALPRDRRRFVAITSGPGGTAFYLDGILAKASPKLFLQPDTFRGRLILGTSPGGRNKWIGKMYGLAAFKSSLNAAEVLRHYRIWTGPRPQEIASEAALSALYLFDERNGRMIQDHSASRHPLLIPEYFQAFSRSFLHPPWRDYKFNRSDLEDIGINILGFVPFGFFCFIYLIRVRPGHSLRNTALTVLWGTIISLAIELAQAYLPTRDSSLTDVICNIVGTLVGVLLITYLPALLKTHRADLNCPWCALYRLIAFARGAAE